ncbi:hypothetical protein DXG01_011865 [Tephrocybe rancida]|nr:hypothetical protein DXG01_011865 [Tephrocybe rancida]
MELTNLPNNAHPLRNFAAFALLQGYAPLSTSPVPDNTDAIAIRDPDPKPLVATTHSSTFKSLSTSSNASRKSTLKRRNSRKLSRRHSSQIVKGSRKEETIARETMRKDQIAQGARRKAQDIQASKVVTLDNSPVNPQQYTLLRMIYDKITTRPMRPWLVSMAIVINRTPDQIKNWFANQRQRDARNQVLIPPHYRFKGTSIRLLQRIVELYPGETWSDCFFEGVVRMCYFRIIYSYKVAPRPTF